MRCDGSSVTLTGVAFWGPGTMTLTLSGEGDPECNLATSAVSGQSRPAGPQWSAGPQPLRPRALAYDKPLCASLDGFTLHAATRAGGLDAEGREALLQWALDSSRARAPGLFEPVEFREGRRARRRRNSETQQGGCCFSIRARTTSTRYPRSSGRIGRPWNLRR